LFQSKVDFISFNSFDVRKWREEDNVEKGRKKNSVADHTEERSRGEWGSSFLKKCQFLKRKNSRGGGAWRGAVEGTKKPVGGFSL